MLIGDSHNGTSFLAAHKRPGSGGHVTAKDCRAALRCSRKGREQNTPTEQIRETARAAATERAKVVRKTAATVYAKLSRGHIGLTGTRGGRLQWRSPDEFTHDEESEAQHGAIPERAVRRSARTEEEGRDEDS